MTGVRREPRIAVMILVEASWQDSSGARLTVPARMEDKSTNGACIRLRKQICVGARLQIQCRREQFSGTARYCRNVGMEYLVGIQRDPAIMALEAQSPVVAAAAQPQMPVPGPIVHPSVTVSLPPHAHEERPTSPMKAECVSITSVPTRLLPESKQAQRRSEETAAFRGEAHVTEKKLELERKPMRRKWLELPLRQGKQNGSPNTSSSGNGNSGSHSPAAAATGSSSAGAFSECVGSLQVELLPLDELYRNAGILAPPKGYGINKVVEMIRSAHIRDLPKEMRRAAVLMALDSAGVALEQVLRDAKARQGALDSYEADQRKQLESELALKEEQNAQIETELERVRAQYLARIARNMDAMAREKASFENWLTLKRQESQAIAEAAELCSKPEKPAAQLLPELSMVGNDKPE